MILVFIIGCEIAFWLFLIAGLLARYVLHAKHLSAVLLICSPIIDALLLIATAIDLKNGSTPTFAHGLAAIYIGIAVAFGKQLVAATDRRFARWLNLSEPSAAPPKYGKAHAAYERRGWLRHLLAYIIGAGLLLAMMLYIGPGPAAQPLLQVLGSWSIVLVIDFFVSFSYTLFPRSPR